jgi:hypothetical protein
MRWGERKLTALCLQEIGITPKVGDAFLFFSARRDELKLFFRDDTGSNELQKKLPRGGFVLPAASAGVRFTKIAPQILEHLFRR